MEGGRDGFRGREDEPDVAQAATGRLPRRAGGDLAQAIRIGIYPDAERVRPDAGHAVQPPPIARADVNDNRRVVLDQLCEGVRAEATDAPPADNRDIALHLPHLRVDGWVREGRWR